MRPGNANEQGTSPALLVRRVAARLEGWVLDAEQGFDGAPPSPAALATAIRSIARRSSQSGRAETEDVELAGDVGGPKAIRLTARPLEAGVVVVAALWLDGLHEVEDALYRYDGVMRATHDAVWDWKVVSEQAWWNRQQYELLGYDAETTVPSYEGWVRRIHPDDRERVARQFEQVVASGAAVWQDEFRFLGRDDRVGVALDRGYIERDSEGQPLRMIGVMSDITAQRSLEEQLAQARRLESIGRLAGGIAHDFNNLLTVILASLELARRKLPADSPAVVDLDGIGDAAERAATLTSQLLAFARRRVVAPTRLDLNELTRQMEDLLRRVIGEQIELVTVVESPLGTIMADRSQLEQVLVNLAINARDAMPGGGRLTIETRNVPRGAIGVGVAPVPSDHVMLSVSDTGSGIDPSSLPHIFEPFYTTKPVGQGTGLGLATSYGIVRQAGGDILVHTEPGRGTTFQILLPRVAGDPDATEPRSVPTVVGGTESVLFVEDDPGVRRLGVQILRAQGYQVLEAASGPEAVRLAAGHPGPIELLISDMVMPQMSGIELARVLAGQRPEMRVLYTSGHTEVSLAAVAEVAFLPKPYVGDTLLTKVRDVLAADVAERRR